MPLRLAASITSVPAGASIGLSLMVSLTKSGMKNKNPGIGIWLKPRIWDLGFGIWLSSCHHQLRCSFIRARFSKQVRFKLVAKFFHDGDGGQRRGIAQRAERPPQHVLREIADQDDIVALAEPVVKTLQDLSQPRGSFAAGNAPAAALVGVEAHDAQRGFH